MHLDKLSAICFYDVNIFDSDLGFQIDSVKQPIKSNSCGHSGYMSHRWTSSLSFFLITASSSSKCTTETHLEKNVFVGTPFFLLIVPRRTLFLVPSLAFVTVFRVATTVRTKTKTQA